MSTIERNSAIDYEPAARQASPLWPRVGVVLVLVLVPLLLLALPLPPAKGKWGATKQDWVLGISLALTAASAVAYFVPNPLFRPRSMLPLVLGGTSLLVAANAVWNDAYLDYVTAHKEYRREVFRRAMHNLHAPMYGRYDNALGRWGTVANEDDGDDETATAGATSPHAGAERSAAPDRPRTGYSFATLPFVLLSAGVAAGWYYWARRRPLDARWDAKSLAILVAFQLALMLGFALCETPARGGGGGPPQRLTLNISGYSEFAKDIAAFGGIRDTLANYVARMPRLEWYGQHYPPGNLIVLTIEKQLGIPGLTKALVCLLTALATVPLYLLAPELDLDHVATTAALLLFTASTGVLIYCTINTTSMLLFPATVCIWLLVRGLKTGSVAAGIGLGLVYAFYLLFSFSASILGVLMALTTALAWWSGAVTTRKVVRTGVISLASVGIAIAALYLTTRFNLVACFFAAVSGHQDQQGNGGFDNASRWLLRSTGNVLAYLTSIVPLSILAISAAWTVRRESGALRADAPSTSDGLRRSLFIASVLTVFLAGFSGLFYVETERIWIFLTPFFALAAGAELSRRSANDGPRVIYAVVLLVLLISCSQEFLFQHYR